MSERVKLDCPECGAPLPADAANKAVTCERCGHASAPKPQPVVVMATGTGVLCPRCRVSLVPAVAENVTLLGCGVCGGIFLDNEGSHRIVREHDGNVAWLARRAQFHAIAKQVDRNPDALPCPICTAAMKRVAAQGMIDIDYCDRHGTWFDAGEIVRVMPGYVPPFDPSRAAAQARLAALREERTEVENFGNSGFLLGLRDLLGAFVRNN